jgi:hypothetical protein
MREDLLLTESLKLALMHSFETWHMKLVSALADSLLMQSAQTIHVPIWVAPMHQGLQKKVQLLQSGSQQENLTPEIQLVFFGKISR